MRAASRPVVVLAAVGLAGALAAWVLVARRPAEVVEVPDVADVAEEASDIGSSDADASDAGVVESGAKDDGGCAGGGASGLGVAVVLGALWAWRRRVGGTRV